MKDDMNDDKILGGFYGYEWQKVQTTVIYQIEKILLLLGARDIYLFLGSDTVLILILGSWPLLTPSMMIWIKSVIFEKTLSPIKFDGKYEVALVVYILKSTYDILGKDRTYDIKERPLDFSNEGLVANLDSDD